MKKLIGKIAVLGAILSLGLLGVSSAEASFSVPLVATSTTQGWIFPSKVNGTDQSILSKNFIATSTSVNSVFPVFTFTSATGTSATTTNLFSTTASSTNLFGNFISGFGFVDCVAATSALTYTAATQRVGCHTISASGGGSGNIATSSQETATYVPFYTSTNGTPATLSGGLSLFTFASGQGLLTISSLLATYASTTNLLATGSSTLQAFTATQGTTTNATTTTAFATTASSTNLFSTNANLGFLNFGNATGTAATTTSEFATTASSTNLYSAFGTLGNLLVNGSSTLQNHTGVNSTTTNATTTNFFATTASTSNLYLNLGPCSTASGNALGLTAGKTTCGVVTVSGGNNSFSTTSVQNLATTTIRASEFPAGNTCTLFFHSPDMVGSASTTAQAAVYVIFNSAAGNFTDQYMSKALNAAAAVTFVGGYGRLTSGMVGGGFVNDGVRNIQTDFQMTFPTTASLSSKLTRFDFQRFSTTTSNAGGNTPSDNSWQGDIEYGSSTPAITSLDIFTGGAVDKAAFATSTTLRIVCQ